jgi:hypothetical protein
MRSHKRLRENEKQLPLGVAVNGRSRCNSMVQDEGGMGLGDADANGMRFGDRSHRISDNERRL